ncbi:MAG TPA: hypothetical protein VGI97_11490 [Gemmatimonadaceae bacterium]|jgi:hypothetical protein
MRRSVSILAALAAAAALGAQQPSNFSYDFRTTGDHDSNEMNGTVRVRGGRARVDVQDDRGDRQYMLVSADGSTVTIVKPEDRTYTVFSGDDFAHIASLGVRAAGKMVTMKLHDATIESTRLGRGEMIAGRPTQRVRVTESWSMDVGAMGFTTPMNQTVETEYYFDPSFHLPRNPLEEIVTSAMTVMPATDAEFAAREDSVRKSIVRGMPLRTVVTEHDENGRTSRLVVEVTKIGSERVTDEELRVPAGYTKKDGDLGRFKVKL